MLKQTLCCFQGVSAAAERKLWNAGCLAWEYLPRAGRVLSARRAASLAVQLPAMRAALDGRVGDFFLGRLPAGHRLRIWPDFGSGVGFLDVETTGLSRHDELTVLGLWRDGNLMQFVRGRGLEDFLRAWRHVEVAVTFNGVRFDLPVIARAFGLGVLPPHIDLMQEAKVYGLVGGLKVIEQRRGIRRAVEEAGDGSLAVQLWQEYRDGGDKESLRRLLAYNAADVRSLMSLAQELFRRSWDGYPGPRPSPPLLNDCSLTIRCREPFLDTTTGGVLY